MFKGSPDSFYADFGTEIFIDGDKLRNVALRVCELAGPNRIPESIYATESRLGKFVTENFSGKWWLDSVKGTFDTYDQLLTGHDNSQLFRAFVVAFLQVPASDVLGLLIGGLRCEEAIKAHDVIVASPTQASQLADVLGQQVDDIDPTFYPASALSRRSTSHTPVDENNTWVFVTGRNKDELESNLNVALGAIWAVLESWETRFSMARSNIGYQTWDTNGTVTIFAKRDPYLGHLGNQTTIKADHASLFCNLLSPSCGAIPFQRRRLALEFATHHWKNDGGIIGFSNCIIALDALVGETAANTQSIRTAVTNLLNDPAYGEKAFSLFKLRGAILHGGVTSIFQSSRYLKYVRKYKSEPEKDAVDILRACLRAACKDKIISQ